jgi:hypothetical protein
LSNPAALTSAAPIPGCGSASGSIEGLQLTTNGQSEQGGLAYGLSVPTSAGLDATFDTYQWGGDGADGISFFLAATDPANPVAPSIGPPGGPLGYAPNNITGQTTGPGVSDGYLGFGLDAFGNFVNSSDSASGCSTSSQSTGLPNAVDVRGPGNDYSGYCLLANTTALSGSLRSSATPTAVPVEVAVNPSTSEVTTTSGLMVPPTSWIIAVQPIGAGATSSSGCPTNWQCLTGILPSAQGLIPSSFLDSAGIPEQLTFGWAGSTGSSDDYHLINDVEVSTLTGAPPNYDVSLADNTGGQSVTTAQQVEFDASVTVAATPEHDPVTITDNLPAGLQANPATDTVSTSVTGGSFACSSAVAASESCTFNPPSGGLPVGTVLQVAFGATVTTTATASGPLADEVTASSPDGLPGSATDTLEYAAPAAVTLSTASATVAGVETVAGSVVPSPTHPAALHSPAIHRPGRGNGHRQRCRGDSPFEHAAVGSHHRLHRPHLPGGHRHLVM